MSSVRFQLFNRTAKNFQDIKLFIEIKPIDGNPIQLLSKDIKGPSGYPKDGFQELSPKASSVGWIIDSVNASDSLLDTYEVSLLFLGVKAPEVDITLLKTGVGLEALDIKDDSALKLLSKVIGVVIGVLFYITFFIWIIRISRRRKAKLNNDVKFRLSSYLQNNKETILKADPDLVADIFSNIQKEARIAALDPVDAFIYRIVSKLRGDQGNARQSASSDAGAGALCISKKQEKPRNGICSFNTCGFNCSFLPATSKINCVRHLLHDHADRSWCIHNRIFEGARFQDARI